MRSKRKSLGSALRSAFDITAAEHGFEMVSARGEKLLVAWGECFSNGAACGFLQGPKGSEERARELDRLGRRHGLGVWRERAGQEKFGVE